MLINLKALGKSDNTLRFISDRLRYLSKHVDLNNPEMVNLFIANKQCSESYKESLIKSYVYYAKYKNIPYVKPKFKYERKIPKIPTKEAIMKVISSSSKKYATIFKILMETGIMPYELSRVSLKDIDLEKGTIVVRGYKGHNSRIFKLRTDTLAMLKEYVQRYYNDKLFPDSMYIGKMWRKIRNKVAKKLKDPNIKAIRLYDLRHYYATMLYYHTKDILLVKQQLGHKKLETSLIYTQLVNFNEEDEFYSATAKNIQEATKLIENGFEYVTTFNDIMIFRKRK
jgi:integrase